MQQRCNKTTFEGAKSVAVVAGKVQQGLCFFGLFGAACCSCCTLEGIKWNKKRASDGSADGSHSLGRIQNNQKNGAFFV